MCIARGLGYGHQYVDNTAPVPVGGVLDQFSIVKAADGSDQVVAGTS